MHFEQTSEWARFQSALRREVYLLTPTGCASYPLSHTSAAEEGIAIVRRIFFRLQYLEVTGWPTTYDDMGKTTSFLQMVGQKAGAMFVRWTPLISQKSKVKSQKFGDVKVLTPEVFVRQMPPKATLVIDLAKDDETLLKEMHEKTRYNIRLAERKGVAVKSVDRDEGIEAFWVLMQETARRDRIGIHGKEYYYDMLKVVQGRETHARLFLALHEEEALATAILIICGDTATYLHGGSSSTQRGFMAPHLLQWRMMQFAKAQGCRWYDMWGVAPKAQQTQNSKLKTQNYGTWAGITRFKMGFGGEVREYAGTFDIVCKPGIYKLLSLGRRFKEIFR